MKNTHYSDAGHGWVSVKRAELVALGILELISGFSYQRGNTVYLEEDGDAGTWIKAYTEKHGDKPVMASKYHDDQSPIRSYQSFNPVHRPVMQSELVEGMQVRIYSEVYTVVEVNNRRIVVQDKNGKSYRGVLSKMRKA